MLVTEAMNEFIKEIESEQERQVQDKALVDAASRAKRDEFITALRERIEGEYGLKLTIMDLDQWQVTKAAGDLYEMRWVVGDTGNAALDRNLSAAQVRPGLDSVSIAWSAYHMPSRWTASFDSLIPALVYAKTGKHL